jgi:putative transcriptional regulator
MVLARDYGRGSGDGGAWRGKKNAAQFSPRAGSLHAVDPAFIREMRERLRRSRAVFARRLRVNERTLEKWEEGRAKPNPRAVAVLLLVRSYPDYVKAAGVGGALMSSERICTQGLKPGSF